MPRRRHNTKGDLDNPELTEEFFRRARPAIEVVPDIVEAWRAGRLKMPDGTRVGKPYMKTQVSLELDAGVLEAFKATGAGWERRINDTLARAVRTKRSAPLKRAAGPKRKAQPAKGK